MVKWEKNFPIHQIKDFIFAATNLPAPSHPDCKMVLRKLQTQKEKESRTQNRSNAINYNQTTVMDKPKGQRAL